MLACIFAYALFWGTWSHNHNHRIDAACVCISDMCKVAYMRYRLVYISNRNQLIQQSSQQDAPGQNDKINMHDEANLRCTPCSFVYTANRKGLSLTGYLHVLSATGGLDVSLKFFVDKYCPHRYRSAPYPYKCDRPYEHTCLGTCTCSILSTLQQTQPQLCITISATSR